MSVKARNQVKSTRSNHLVQSQTFGQICKKCKKENHIVSKCHLHGKKSSSKEKKPKATKPSSKKSVLKKVNALEAHTSSEEELLAVELSTEDVNVSTAKWLMSVLSVISQVRFMQLWKYMERP